MIEKAFTFVGGVSESGKNIFALRYLLNHPDRHCLRVIFDRDGENARRLGLAPAGQAAEIDKAAMLGWVCFDPAPIFGTDQHRAFRFLCEWCLAQGERTGRRVVLLADEVWEYCDPYTLPDELARLLQQGRKKNVEGVFGAQRPNKVNGSIFNEATEMVCFRLQERAGLNAMEEYGFPRDIIERLPYGSFHALNKRTGAAMAGRVY